LLAKSLPGRPLTEILGIYPGGFQPGRLPPAFPRRAAGTAIGPEASFAPPGSACISLFDQEQGLLFAADTLMPGGVMSGVFGSGSISDYIQSLERLMGLNSKILLSGHGRLSRYAAGRCQDRDPAVACAVVGHRAVVRRAGCAIEFRADY
jgi:hypothetical protein